MTTYQAVASWAERTKRVSVQVWLPRDVVEALDQQAEARQVRDPITGKARKVGRAEVLTALVRDGRSLWKDLIETVEGTCATWKGLSGKWEEMFEDQQQRAEDLDAEVAQAGEAQRKAESHADRIQGELDALKARVAELETAVRCKDHIIEGQNRRILDLMQPDVDV